jgi:hypothetical protein
VGTYDTQIRLAEMYNVNMAVHRPTLFTPEELADLLPEEEETRHAFAEMRRNQCVIEKPEVAALVRGGYAAACDGRLVGHAATWEALRERLIRDGWYGPEADAVGLIIRRVGTPDRRAATSGRDG